MSKSIVSTLTIISVLIIGFLSGVTNAKTIIVPENYYKKIVLKQPFLVLSAETQPKCYFGYCFLDLPKITAEKLISSSFAIEDRPIFKIHRLESLSLTSVYKLWNQSYLGLNLTGSGIKVAIIDSGINISHPDINYTFANKENWRHCYNSILDKNASSYGNLSVCNDNIGHGTFVSGIVAGRYEGDLTKCFEGYECGVAPNATLMVIKVFDSESTTLENILDGLNYAVNNGADIISMSFGADENVSCYDDPEVSILSNVVDEITKNGTITIASAGNGLDTNGDGNIDVVERTIFPPACSKNVIAVGSTDKGGKISSFSSRGPTDDDRIKPDLVAPGEVIHSTTLDGYGYGSGTSFSAPFISGIAALVKEYTKERNISLDTEKIKAILLASANPYGQRNNVYGSGMVNATRAIEVLNESKFFSIEVPYKHPVTYRVNLTSKPTKIVIYSNSNSSENFILDARLITENETVYSNAYNTSDNVHEILYNGSANSGWLYLKMLTNSTKNFSLAYVNAEIEKIPTEFIYVISPSKDRYLATESINISVFVGDKDGNPYNKSVNMTIHYPNSTSKTIELNYSNGSCNYVFHPDRQGNYTFEFYSEYPNVIIESKNITVEVKSYLFNLTIPFENQTYLINDTLFSIVKVVNVTGNNLNKSVLRVNATLLNSSYDVVNNNIVYALMNESNETENLALFNTSFRLNVTPGRYYLKVFLYVDESLADNSEVPIIVTNKYLMNVTTNATNNHIYYPNTTINFSINAFHPNGTKINISQLKSSVYFLNSDGGIVNQVLDEPTGTIELNSSTPGDYYLIFNISDKNGNYQNYSLLLHISYKVRNTSLELEKDNYTIDEDIILNATIFENETSKPVYLANVTAELFDNETKETIVANSSLTNEQGLGILYLHIPKETINGTYYIEVSATGPFNYSASNKTKINVITLFPVIYTNNFINTGSNITINVTVLNYTRSEFIKNYTIVANITAYSSSGIPKENSTTVSSNNTYSLVNFTSMSDLPTTYSVKILVIDNSTGLRGFNETKIYSGVVLRPSSNINKIGCKPKIISNMLKDYCVLDSHNQHDLEINPNENLTFSASLYYGSTIDEDNYPTNITYNVTVTNSTGSEVVRLNNSINGTNNVTIIIPPLNKSGLYHVKITIKEFNPGETLEDEFNVSVEKLNVTIISPTDKSIYDTDNPIRIYGTVEKNGKRIENANILIHSNTTEFDYSCENNNITNSTGEFSCLLYFDKPGNYLINVSSEDEYGIEGYDTVSVETKDLSIETSVSPSDIYNGTEVKVTANIKLLPDDSWINGGIAEFTFYGDCNNNEKKTITIEKQTGYSFTATFTPPKPGKCYVDIYVETNSSNSTLSESKTISFEVKEKTQSKPPATITASLEITDYGHKLYLKPGESNYTLVEVLAYNTEIIQNVSLYVLSIPSSWYKIEPTSLLIEPNKAGVFNVTFTIPKDVSSGEYTGYFKVNSTYASDTKAFKLVILSLEETNRTSNITEEAKVFYDTYKQKLNEWNSSIYTLKEEKYNTTTLEILYSEIEELLNELNQSIENGNNTYIESIMEKIKQKEIEISSAFQKVEPIEQNKSKNRKTKTKIIVIATVLIVSVILAYLLWPYETKPKYNHKKGRFSWKPPKEKTEIDMLWEKIKEKIQKIAS